MTAPTAPELAAACRRRAARIGDPAEELWWLALADLWEQVPAVAYWRVVAVTEPSPEPGWAHAEPWDVMRHGRPVQQDSKGQFYVDQWAHPIREWPDSSVEPGARARWERACFRVAQRLMDPSNPVRGLTRPPDRKGRP